MQELRKMWEALQFVFNLDPLDESADAPAIIARFHAEAQLLLNDNDRQLGFALTRFFAKVYPDWLDLLIRSGGGAVAEQLQLRVAIVESEKSHEDSLPSSSVASTSSEPAWMARMRQRREERIAALPAEEAERLFQVTRPVGDGIRARLDALGAGRATDEAGSKRVVGRLNINNFAHMPIAAPGPRPAAAPPSARPAPSDIPSAHPAVHQPTLFQFLTPPSTPPAPAVVAVQPLRAHLLTVVNEAVRKYSAYHGAEFGKQQSDKELNLGSGPTMGRLSEFAHTKTDFDDAAQFGKDFAAAPIQGDETDNAAVSTLVAKIKNAGTTPHSFSTFLVSEVNAFLKKQGVAERLLPQKGFFIKSYDNEAAAETFSSLLTGMLFAQSVNPADAKNPFVLQQ